MMPALSLSCEDVKRTAAVVCMTCRHAKETRCSVSGLPIPIHVHGLPCPQARHPDGEGHVTRLGLKHVGMPWLWRVWRWSEARDERWLHLPGCGCIVALKAAWLNLWARVGAGR